MEGLAAQHVIATGKSYYSKAGGGPKYGNNKGGAGGGGPPLGHARRMMRVAAELASLPDLAVNWASSILVRSDE